MFSKLNPQKRLRKSTFEKIQKNQEQRFYIGTRLYEQAINNKHKTPKQTPRLRPSSFPNCSIVLYLDFLKASKEGGFYEMSSASSDYFTSVGTVAHENIQYHMGFTNKIFGDWYCTNLQCSKGQDATILYNEKGEIIKDRILTSIDTTDSICPECKKRMAYAEKRVEILGLKGHVDCIIVHNNKLWILDYKTTTKYRLQNKPLPYSSHIAQVASYALALEKQGYKIAGFSLLYFSRDNPFDFLECPFEWSKKWRLKALTKIKKEKVIFQAGLDAFKQKNRDIAIENKPCSCKTYHDKYIDIYEPCPFVSVCFNPDKLERKIKQLERSYRHSEEDKIKILNLLEQHQ